MTGFFVQEMTWEHGKKFGDVYYPKDFEDFKQKVAELDRWGRERNYPFLIELYPTANGSYLGFTVAHEYSLVQFGYDNHGKLDFPYYLINPDGREDEIIPIYYFASWTEPDTTRMLPLGRVLDAVFYYVEKQKFPPFIRFDDDDVNAKFVEPGEPA